MAGSSGKSDKDLDKIDLQDVVLGALYSVWYRESRRHKWVLEYSFVRPLRIHDKTIVIQTSQCNIRDGPVSFNMNGSGTWERAFARPVLYDYSKELRHGN